jgi:uncharacterized membrane protein YccC
VHAPVLLSRSGPSADARPVTTSIPIAPGTGSHVSPSGVSDSDERLESLTRVIRFGFVSWEGIVARGPDGDPDRVRQTADELDEQEGDGAVAAVLRAEGDADPDADSAEVRPRRTAALPQLARTAVQVGVAAALSITAGTALSSTRWFWAVIAAFVMYVGTSNRGEILTKGWQRIAGTLGGVVVGVLIAGLVGGDLVVSLVLIVVCLFVGFYFMQVSSAWMIFGITTMLALLYGLLGEFSVGLLLLRLEETAVGAVIGIVVSYVVFPSSTRDAMRSGTRAFLSALTASLDTAEKRLSSTGGSSDAATAAPDDARALRSAFTALTTTSKPVTQGWAGVSNRSGSRRTLVILGACEYHGRALLRRADGAVGAADTPGLREALDRALRAVTADIETFTEGLDGRIQDVVFHPAGDLIDLLENHPDLGSSSGHRTLKGVARHLHAIDQALCGRGSELGARQEPLAVAPATAG